jgi:6-phosphogluconolactonase (cycloisomerase 2 family)
VPFVWIRSGGQRCRRILLALLTASISTRVGAQTIDVVQTLGSGTYGGGRIALSPDGTNLYLTHAPLWEFSFFTRDPSTGALTLLAEPGPVCGDDVVVSPNGAHVYLACSDEIQVFDRDGTGLLTPSSTRSLASGAGPCALALSPDGAYAYAACEGANAALVSAVDADTGALAEPTSVDAQGSPRDIAISAGGEHVYVSSFDDDALRFCTRNADTGALSFIESYVQGVNGVAGLDQVEDVAITPDGLGVYALGRHEPGAAIAAFARDPVTGSLSFAQEALLPGPPTWPPDVPGIRLAADDGVVWMSSHFPGPDEQPLDLFAFTRDPASNVLAFAAAASLIDAQTYFGPGGLVIDPHGGVIATGAYVGMFRARLVPEPGAVSASLAGAAALLLGARNRRRPRWTSADNESPSTDRAASPVSAVASRRRAGRFMRLGRQ